jgi:uncharacterized membrane protein
VPQSVIAILELVVHLGEIIGASALILGFVLVTIRCVRQIRTLGAVASYYGYRKGLGRVVLVGLEILVAVTIIKTVTIDPSPESLGLLAITIVIRTILSWTTVLEMNGRWPWQKASASNSISESPELS